MENKTEILVKGVDRVTKSKAMFVLKTKKKNLSSAVREMLEELAKEFDGVIIFFTAFLSSVGSFL